MVDAKDIKNSTAFYEGIIKIQSAVVRMLAAGVPVGAVLGGMEIEYFDSFEQMLSLTPDEIAKFKAAIVVAREKATAEIVEERKKLSGHVDQIQNAKVQSSEDVKSYA